MARVIEHRKVLILRKQGKSYSQINRELGIPKSTLSDWLCKLPLSKSQIRLLRDFNQQRIEKCRNTKRKKLERRLLEKYKIQKKKIGVLSKRELFIAGLFLYWGEGGKSSRNVLSLCNTDPSVIKFTLFWINKCLHVSKKKIHINLHLYSDMDVTKETNYWSRVLRIGKDQFTKPYIKKSKKTDLDQKSFGHGTCSLYVCNTSLKENILMTIKVISDIYGEISTILV